MVPLLYNWRVCTSPHLAVPPVNDVSARKDQAFKDMHWTYKDKELKWVLKESFKAKNKC